VRWQFSILNFESDTIEELQKEGKKSLKVSLEMYEEEGLNLICEVLIFDVPGIKTKAITKDILDAGNESRAGTAEGD
jgi:hypothetical protein